MRNVLLRVHNDNAAACTSCGEPLAQKRANIWKPRPLPSAQWCVQFNDSCIAVATHVNGPEPDCLYFCTT
jgi:hypothetical protein